LAERSIPAKIVSATHCENPAGNRAATASIAPTVRASTRSITVLRICPQKAPGRGAVEMPPLHIREAIKLVLAQQGHREPGFMQRILIRAAALDGPDRHDVVERR